MLLFCNKVLAQTKKYTLKELVQIAQTKSVASKIAIANKDVVNIHYKNFLLQKKPTLILNGNIPVYDKDNFSVRQPDGTIKFLNRSQINSNIGLGFVQPIVATGGNISVNTSLNRFDELIGKNQTYNGTPIYIQLQQPLFAYNNYKWQRIIEPLKLDNATLNYQQSLQDLAYTMVTAFFNMATYKTEQEILVANMQYIKDNLTIELRKKQLGKGDNDKILQLQIQLLNQQQQIDNNNLLIKNNKLQMSNIAQLENSDFDIEIPKEFIKLPINANGLMDSIKKYNPNLHNYTITKQELLAEKERIQKEKTTVNLLVSYGLNQSGNALKNVYTNPNDQQRFNIGFTIPLADWGRQKNNAAQIQVKQKLVQLQEAQQYNDLQTEMEATLNTLQQIKMTYTNSLQLDSLSKERLSITNKLFTNGKVILLELNAAILENGNSKRTIQSLLKEYYLLYYKLEQICNCSLQ